MTSKEQIAANRQNAKKSIGPKTAAGKTRSRMNATRHGLRAQDVLTPDECRSEFEEFRSRGLNDLNPVGFLETELAEAVISSFWRKQRCVRIEAGLLGGGRQVMEKIEAQSVETFMKMLGTKLDFKDCTTSQILLEVINGRLNHDYDGGAPKPDLFRYASNEQLADLYEEARENDRQENPLSYDIALGFKRDLRDNAALGLLARYETALDRTLHRDLIELKRLQAERKAEAENVAPVIDVADLNQKKI